MTSTGLFAEIRAAAALAVGVACSAPLPAQDGDRGGNGGFGGAVGRAVGKLLSSNGAGVRLGMGAEEARRTRRSRGFTLRAGDAAQDSWARRISQNVAQRRGTKVEGGTVPAFTMADGPQGERIDVFYAAAPAGAVVTSLKYAVPTERMERAAFVQGLQTRYGEPTSVQRRRSYYCTGGDARCPALVGDGDLPMMRAETSEFDRKHIIELREGSRASELRKAEFAAAVEAAAPRDARVTF